MEGETGRQQGSVLSSKRQDTSCNSKEHCTNIAKLLCILELACFKLVWIHLHGTAPYSAGIPEEWCAPQMTSRGPLVIVHIGTNYPVSWALSQVADNLQKTRAKENKIHMNSSERHQLE